MAKRRKTYTITDWRLTMNQIGRGLRKIYASQQKLPNEFNKLIAQLERSPARPSARLQKRRQRNNRNGRG
jgi:hypothetical protein